MDSHNEDPEFDALGHAWHEGWDAGVTHVEYPLNEIWKRWQEREHEVRAAFLGEDTPNSAYAYDQAMSACFVELLDDIGDLLDFLGK